MLISQGEKAPFGVFSIVKKAKGRRSAGFRVVKKAKRRENERVKARK